MRKKKTKKRGGLLGNWEPALIQMMPQITRMLSESMERDSKQREKKLEVDLKVAEALVKAVDCLNDLTVKLLSDRNSAKP